MASIMCAGCGQPAAGDGMKNIDCTLDLPTGATVNLKVAIEVLSPEDGRLCFFCVSSMLNLISQVDPTASEVEMVGPQDEKPKMDS